jgi:hypothetical protein
MTASSNDTAKRRTSERAGDTGRDLIEENERWKLFTIELEEFTDILHNSIMLMYVRYMYHGESTTKEDILSVSELLTRYQQ